MEQQEEGCSGCGKGNAQTQILSDNPNDIMRHNAPCEGCSKKSFTGKLGTCIDCIVANVIGAVFSWLVLVALLIFQVEKNILYGVLVLGSFFTLLLSAHGIAYLIKKSKK